MRSGLLMLLSLVLAGPAAADVPWLLVDTGRGILSVIQDEQTLLEIDGIAIGRGGASPLHTANDGTTPLGQFRIAWINTDSPYHLFFGFDYPNWDQTFEAYSRGLIDTPTLLRISHALGRGLVPPQDTALGGGIGIHGVGKGDPKVHQRFNWTEGCVAISNEQIDQLANWVTIGTYVVIE
jgi:murein L,D-transpeptidase YafK